MDKKAQPDITVRADISPARIAHALDVIRSCAMGADVMDVVFTHDAKNPRKTTINFDVQIDPDALGLCHKKNSICNISIAPDVDDALLPAVILHELRHVIHPKAPETRHLPNLAMVHFMRNRLIEGDAFVHQFIFGLQLKAETGNDSVANANDAFCKRRMSTEQHEHYRGICGLYEKATDENGKRAAMRDLFMLVQQSLLQRYDGPFIATLDDIIQTHPASQQPRESLTDLNADMLMRMDKLPDHIFHNIIDKYLGDDYERTYNDILGTISPAIADGLMTLHEKSQNILKEKSAAPAQNSGGLAFKP